MREEISTVNQSHKNLGVQKEIMERPPEEIMREEI
jgi:hypothetical protein